MVEREQTNKKVRKFEETKKFEATVEGTRVADKKPGKFVKKEKKAGAQKVGKEKRTWDDAPDPSLDRSGQQDRAVKSTEDLIDTADFNKLISNKVGGMVDVLEMEEKAQPKTQGWSLPQLSLSKTLTKEGLAPVLKAMKEHLIEKNVAKEVADHLCESVSMSLVGSSVSAFSGLNTMVRQATQNAVSKLLTPQSTIDIIREIKAQILDPKTQRPYVIAFIGVNGVGKSTNLSKVCFWLLQNKFSTLIAACDTFRSGAVEQLNVHVQNLNRIDAGGKVELYQKGYGKDAALIAKDAIYYAEKQKFDVVLVDTAGRMQDNEPLMRSLAKLVALNDPDKLLFVGEALVGNEAVDQLSKFNKALIDYAPSRNATRQIDGIILSKFDTVDDKVGAALTMTFITGKPVVFVGTGQTYTDLKKMNIKSIVTQLLS